MTKLILAYMLRGQKVHYTLSTLTCTCLLFVLRTSRISGVTYSPGRVFAVDLSGNITVVTARAGTTWQCKLLISHV